MKTEWDLFLKEKQNQEYMMQLREFIKNERDSGKIIHPKGELVFNAFKLTPFEKIKVVIIGQDTYHTPSTAHGLAFSSLSKTTPPSLQNIFKEEFDNMRQELQETNPKIPIQITINDCFRSNDLTFWAEQGVFLINSILTVEQGKPLSHEKKGWERFVAEVLMYISQNKKGVVWMLWGAHAQKAEKFIMNKENHLILKAAHPSPLSANKGGWFGNNHFYKANQYFKEQRLKTGKAILPINWGVYK